MCHTHDARGPLFITLTINRGGNAMNKLCKTIFVALTLIVFPLTLTPAEEKTQISAEAEDVITIEHGAIATTIETRIPQRTAQSFPATVGKLYCFTKVAGAKTETSITHTWYYQDKKMAEVVLPIRSLYWRTWSSKKIIPEWKGHWKVEITSKDGTLLKTITFTIE